MPRFTPRSFHHIFEDGELMTLRSVSTHFQSYWHGCGKFQQLRELCYVERLNMAETPECKAYENTWFHYHDLHNNGLINIIGQLEEDHPGHDTRFEVEMGFDPLTDKYVTWGEDGEYTILAPLYRRVEKKMDEAVRAFANKILQNKA